MKASQRPLDGVRVIEFTHMVMGPTIGLILADLGADVVKVEPLKGDNTRRLLGSGAGYFPMYNRNKRSVCIDTKTTAGREAIDRLLAASDVFIENFRPGAMSESGWDYATLSKKYPRLIYCSAKGFLQGPYEHRTALDEVAQMMGGLAYMTGLPGKPMRAGASVIDVTGGMFGVIAILAALWQREHTGLGQEVRASLYETCVFLVGQHMAQLAVTGSPAPPMTVRRSAWAIYDVFDTCDEQQVFIGVVTDSQWRKFCEAFEFPEFLADRSLAANGDRVMQRERIIEPIRARIRRFGQAELMTRLENIGLPFAPVARPEDLFDDPHLNAAGGLVGLRLPSGQETRLPALPIQMQGGRFDVRHDVPRESEHAREVLRQAGYSDAEINRLATEGVVRLEDMQ
ncbi:MAG TPA: CaiB/BaiF CoA-transferase family protein [Steroidobacter sp.]|uniref:CaiB/BaiF CoA transferase family protein n=1 Tax=Steroidobacter sp. TaxID=1978227 RepID=UPI002EDB9AF8